MVVGLTLAAGLLLVGLGSCGRQVVALRRLAERKHVPSDERGYLRGQARRRLATSALLAVVGGLIGGAYVSGMEERTDEIAARRQAANGEPPADPPDPADRQFAQFYAAYWMGVIGLLGATMMLAVYDVWATRRYWYGQYRRIRADHQTLLERDLAVYRQQKAGDRFGRTRRGETNPDDA